MSGKFCNNCLREFQIGESAAATSCAHLFCRACCSELDVNGTRRCPAQNCDTVFTKEGDLREVAICMDTEPHKLLLAGAAPETALSLALYSVQFDARQKEMYANIEKAQMQQRMEKLRQQCEKKLSEVHNGYKNAKKKYEQERNARQAAEAAHQELRDKYNRKAKEASQLRDAMPKLQHENDELRRALMQLCQRFRVPPNTVPVLQGTASACGGAQYQRHGAPAPHLAVGPQPQDRFISENLGRRPLAPLQSGSTPLLSPGYRHGGAMGPESPAFNNLTPANQMVPRLQPLTGLGAAASNPPTMGMHVGSGFGQANGGFARPSSADMVRTGVISPRGEGGGGGGARWGGGDRSGGYGHMGHGSMSRPRSDNGMRGYSPRLPSHSTLT